MARRRDLAYASAITAVIDEGIAMSVDSTRADDEAPQLVQCTLALQMIEKFRDEQRIPLRHPVDGLDQLIRWAVDAEAAEDMTDRLWPSRRERARLADDPTPHRFSNRPSG